jgi:single-strand DNA-binding protein
MNKVELVGRLTAKPELRYTSSNMAYARFSVAINRTYTNAQGERGTDFINVVVWGKQAENVANYLDKGRLVAVEGSIQTGSYTDKDGNKRTSFDVRANNVEFLSSKSQGQESKTVSLSFSRQAKKPGSRLTRHAIKCFSTLSPESSGA